MKFDLALPNKVFFYCCDADYQHLSICIAEGLKQLGIPFYANINYWKLSPNKEEYLFQYVPDITPDQCDIVIVEKQWVIAYNSLPDHLFHPERKYLTIYLDDQDWLPIIACQPIFRNFDLIFRTHCNQQTLYPDNFVAWSFGLSERIIEATKTTRNFSERIMSLLVNFRVNHGLINFTGFTAEKLPPGVSKFDDHRLRIEYPLRNLFINNFCPLIKQLIPIDQNIEPVEQFPDDPQHYLYWKQTGRRHNPNYYQRLRNSLACATVGGYLVPQTVVQPAYLEWWDSWRFWESLAAGCVTFHVDFDKYGIDLPIKPKNWQHYIGLDLDNLEATINRLCQERNLLQYIGEEGRKWAIDNYSPVATANRFLEIIVNHPRYLAKKNLLGQLGDIALFLPIQQGQINLIIFPDWHQATDLIFHNLVQVFQVILTHPQKSKMSLLIDTQNINLEDAEFILGDVLMYLYSEENLEIDDNNAPEFKLININSQEKYKALLTFLHSRIILEYENQELISQIKLENLASYTLEQLNNKFLNLNL